MHIWFYVGIVLKPGRKPDLCRNISEPDWMYIADESYPGQP